MYKREYIDLAYLEGAGTRHGLRRAIEEALEYKPRGLCLYPVARDYIEKDETIHNLYFGLIETEVLRQFVIDFAQGQGGLDGKFLVAEQLVREGLVDEFDVVANIGAIIEEDFKQFEKELKDLICLQKPIKVIVETGYYADKTNILERVLHWCADVGVFAIKTSTGYIKNIDNETKCEHVKLWRYIIDRENYNIKIKDAGGKRTREDIDNSINAGADIVGTSVIIQ